MSLKIRKLYFDIKKAALELKQFTTEKSFEAFKEDRMLQVAVEREFEIIGEAMNRMLRQFPEEAETIPNLGRIIGMRNILAHGYDTINHEILWNTIQVEINPLIKFVESKV